MVEVKHSVFWNKRFTPEPRMNVGRVSSVLKVSGSLYYALSKVMLITWILFYITLWRVFFVSYLFLCVLCFAF